MILLPQKKRKLGDQEVEDLQELLRTRALLWMKNKDSSIRKRKKFQLNKGPEIVKPRQKDLRGKRDPSSCVRVLLANLDMEGSKCCSKPKHGEPVKEDLRGETDPSSCFPVLLQNLDMEGTKSSSKPKLREPEEWWKKWWELEGEEEDLDLPKSPGWGYRDVDEEDPLWADKFREKYRRQTPPKYKAALERGYCPPGVEKKDDALWERYLKQIKESDGYDITDFPGLTPLTPLTPMLEFKKSPSDFKAVSAFADAAIKNFNSCMKEEDQYEVHDILTVNVSGGSCRIFIYYITFEAKTKTSVIRASTDDVEDDQGRAPLLTTFQARVLENFHTEEVEVQECRIKAPKRSSAA